jgi:hypothetical protein
LTKSCSADRDPLEYDEDHADEDQQSNHQSMKNRFLHQSAAIDESMQAQKFGRLTSNSDQRSIGRIDLDASIDKRIKASKDEKMNGDAADADVEYDDDDREEDDEDEFDNRSDDQRLRKKSRDTVKSEANEEEDEDDEEDANEEDEEDDEDDEEEEKEDDEGEDVEPMAEIDTENRSTVSKREFGSLTRTEPIERFQDDHDSKAAPEVTANEDEKENQNGPNFGEGAHVAPSIVGVTRKADESIGSREEARKRGKTVRNGSDRQRPKNGATQESIVSLKGSKGVAQSTFTSTMATTNTSIGKRTSNASAKLNSSSNSVRKDAIKKRLKMAKHSKRHFLFLLYLFTAQRFDSFQC